MPDYTLAPTETLIREAHLYAQVPTLLTLAGDGTAHLRNDSPTPITVNPYLPALVPATPTAPAGIATVLAPGEGATLTSGTTYVITATTNGRFTIERT